MIYAKYNTPEWYAYTLYDYKNKKADSCGYVHYKKWFYPVARFIKSIKLLIK